MGMERDSMRALSVGGFNERALRAEGKVGAEGKISTSLFPQPSDPLFIHMRYSNISRPHLENLFPGRSARLGSCLQHSFRPLIVQSISRIGALPLFHIYTFHDSTWELR